MSRDAGADAVRAVKGLATVAMLKANYDGGVDHLALYEPFVVDALGSLDTSDLSTDDVQAALEAQHGFRLPTETLKTLLGRLGNKGYVTREGGRYFKTEKAGNVEELAQGRRQAEDRQERLADDLVSYARSNGLAIGSKQDALAWILRFLELNHISLSLSLQGPDNMGSDPSVAVTQERSMSLTAEFLLMVAKEDTERAGILREMLEGFVIQNTLLLSEFPGGVRNFKDLQIFVDSGILMSALGLEGPANEVATKEFLALLRDTGAKLEVFDTTIAEIRSILAVHEDRIGTPEGRAILKQSDLTRYLLDTGASPSDVAEKSALIEMNLKALKFNIREIPNHEARWTMDEKSLAQAIRGKDSVSHPRVQHDVACVTGVVTYRRGRVTKSLDDAAAVFLTTSPIVGTVRSWYYKDGGKGVAPIIHQVQMSNIAWLKKPSSASNLKVHELVALCTSALRPDPATWRNFVEHLYKLEASGEISSDEAAAVVASELTQRILVEESLDFDTDSNSVREVVDRVKDELREEGAVDREALSHMRARTVLAARWVSWLFAGLIGIGVIVASIVAGGEAQGADLVPSPIGILLTALLLFVSAMGVFWGFHLKQGRSRLESFLASLFERVLVGSMDNGSSKTAD